MGIEELCHYLTEAVRDGLITVEQLAAVIREAVRDGLPSPVKVSMAEGGEGTGGGSKSPMRKVGRR